MPDTHGETMFITGKQCSKNVLISRCLMKEVMKVESIVLYYLPNQGWLWALASMVLQGTVPLTCFHFSNYEPLFSWVSPHFQLIAKSQVSKIIKKSLSARPSKLILKVSLEDRPDDSERDLVIVPAGLGDSVIEKHRINVTLG